MGHHLAVLPEEAQDSEILTPGPRRTRAGARVLSPRRDGHCRRGFPCARIPAVSGKARVRVLISGRVQGVAYRYFAEKYALTYGVTGWVRNLFDGRVEVLAEGDRERLDLFLARLKEGPRMARVEGFEVDWQGFTGEFPDFRITFAGF
jgi:acylphosphatase